MELNPYQKIALINSLKKGRICYIAVNIKFQSYASRVLFYDDSTDLISKDIRKKVMEEGRIAFIIKPKRYENRNNRQ